MGSIGFSNYHGEVVITPIFRSVDRCTAVIYPVVKVHRRSGSGPARPVLQRIRWSVGSLSMSARIRGSWARSRSRVTGLLFDLKVGDSRAGRRRWWRRGDSNS